MTTAIDNTHKTPFGSLTVNGFAAENDLHDLQFKLANHLQTTLDVNHTLTVFFNNIAQLFTVESLGFEDTVNTPIMLGQVQKHTVTYNVASNNNKLGILKLTRKKPFLEGELAVLETLIGVLFYPLRNALLYRKALQLSMRDPLTGIGNRQAMENCFEREIKLALRHDNPLSLAIIDIDHFKKMNDTHGHLSGDKVIKHIVHSVKDALRETDQTFRFGGEEFVILLHNTHQEHAKLTAERIRMMIALSPVDIGNEQVHSTVSIGITSLKANDTTNSFLKRADDALYKAKEAGRNRVMHG